MNAKEIVAALEDDHARMSLLREIMKSDQVPTWIIAGAVKATNREYELLEYLVSDMLTADELQSVISLAAKALRRVSEES